MSPWTSGTRKWSAEMNRCWTRTCASFYPQISTRCSCRQHSWVPRDSTSRSCCSAPARTSGSRILPVSRSSCLRSRFPRTTWLRGTWGHRVSSCHVSSCRRWSPRKAPVQAQSWTKCLGRCTFCTCCPRPQHWLHFHLFWYPLEQIHSLPIWSSMMQSGPEAWWWSLANHPQAEQHNPWQLFLPVWQPDRKSVYGNRLSHLMSFSFLVRSL